MRPILIQKMPRGHYRVEFPFKNKEFLDGFFRKLPRDWRKYNPESESWNLFPLKNDEIGHLNFIADQIRKYFENPVLINPEVTDETTQIEEAA